MLSSDPEASCRPHRLLSGTRIHAPDTDIDAKKTDRATPQITLASLGVCPLSRSCIHILKAVSNLVPIEIATESLQSFHLAFQ